eukprot:COSAG02_NODE_39148_length_420_cov_1.211838_1_plen_22_part_10
MKIFPALENVDGIFNILVEHQF